MSLSDVKCYVCGGLTSEMISSFETYNTCLGKCKLLCSYKFSLINEKIKIERFETKKFKVIVLHNIKLTRFYYLKGSSPGIVYFHLASEKYKLFGITPANAEEICKLQLKMLCIE